MVNRAFATVAIAVMLAACGSARDQSASGTLNPSPVGLLVSSPDPAGGPVPQQLQGFWLWESNGCTSPTNWCKVQIWATGFSYNMATGRAVVNGDEIDFFKSPGCDDQNAVGRYRWTLTGKQLHFDALNDDPCGRKDLFANQTYQFIKPLTT